MAHAKHNGDAQDFCLQIALNIQNWTTLSVLFQDNDVLVNAFSDEYVRALGVGRRKSVERFRGALFGRY